MNFTAGFIFDRTASMPASRSSATGCDARAGLRYETDFVYPQDMIGARTAAECAAVKYSITRSQWQAARTA